MVSNCFDENKPNFDMKYLPSKEELKRIIEKNCM